MKEKIKFSSKTVRLEQLYLNPNNLRFADFDEALTPVPKERVKEQSVQDAAFNKMKKSEFQVKALRDSIIEVGYLPIDQLVVSPLGDDSFLVIEGNRRITALKWIEELIKEGTVDFKIRESYSGIPVTVIDAESDSEINRLKIQGIRHISEIRPWGTYQKAILIKTLLEEEKLSPQDVASAIGYRTQEVNRIYNSYRLLKQMEEDSDYGEYVEPDLIGYFYEVVGRTETKDFFKFNPSSGTLMNEDNAKLLYKWIIDDPDNNHTKKLPSPKNIRDLNKIIENEDALQRMKEDNSSLEESLAVALKYESIDWRKEVVQAIEGLKKIPLDSLEGFSNEDLSLLEELKQIIDKRISVYDKIKGFE